MPIKICSQKNKSIYWTTCTCLIFVAGKSEITTKEDPQVAQDLLDTPREHNENSIRMTTNMIDIKKLIFSFIDKMDELQCIYLNL